MRRRWSSCLLAAAACLATVPAASADGCPGAAGACPYTGVAVFGQQGMGTFRFPQAIAVDPQGDVYVADEYSGVVQRFSPRGTFLGQFATWGDDPGEIGAVGGLAVDAQGRIDVLDSAHDRVEQFTPEGALVRAWGAAGSGPGQFRLGDRSPVAGGGIATSPHAVYVADTFNDRIEQFTLDGTFVRSFGERRLKRPQGLAADGRQVLVADDNDHRLVRFTAAGEYVRVGGSYGRGAGQLRYPYDVSLDAAGNAWVADNIGGRIVVFDKDLRPKGVFGGFGHSPGRFAFVRSLAVDPVTGRVYVADTANDRIQVLDAAGHVVDAWGASGRGPGNFTDPSDVAVDDRNRIAVADTVDDRVVVDDAMGGQILAGGLRQISRPLGVGALTGGDLAVADTFHDRVVRLGPDGALGDPIGAGPGSGPEQFHSPHGIARGLLGDIWIADTNNDRVEHFAADGRYLGEVGGLHGPQDVAVDTLGDVWIADTGADRLVERSVLGTVVRTVGVDDPVSVATSGLDTVYVASGADARILVLDGRGRRRAAFGAAGSLPGEFVRPGGLAVTATGDLVVTDPRGNRIELFTFGHPAPASTPPAQPAPAAPPAPLVGRLLAGAAAARAGGRLPVGCRANVPGFCDVDLLDGSRSLASVRISLPTAGVAGRAVLRVPAGATGGRARAALTLRGVVRDGAGERVVATAPVTVRGPVHPARHRRHHRRRH